MNNVVSTKEAIKAVQDYLREHSLEEFHQYHGIRGKTDGKLIILDYDMLSVKWDEPYGHVCRGLVLNAENLEVLAFGLKKFFNFGEFRAADIHWDSAGVFEKLDGSMVQRFWNPHNERWEYTTRFQLPRDLAENKVAGFDMTWLDLIERSVREIPFWKYQPACDTVVLEVMSPLNRVVVPHQDYHAKVLTARNIPCLSEGESCLGAFPEEFRPKSFAFNSPEDIQAFVDKHEGTELEGCVVVDQYNERIKIKGSSYVQLHRLRDGLNSAGAFILLAKGGDYEEVVAYFPEYKDFICKAEQVIERIIERHEAVYESLKNRETQKDFALGVQAAGLEVPGALFSTRAGKASTVKEAIHNMREKSFVDTVKRVLGPGFTL